MMDNQTAAKRIAELIREGYLKPARRYVLGLGEAELTDEYVVWSPRGPEGRPPVLRCIEKEMEQSSSISVNIHIEPPAASAGLVNDAFVAGRLYGRRYGPR